MYGRGIASQASPVALARSVAHWSRDTWGYVFWGIAGAVIGIPEITAALWHRGPWPTISGTIGHLELIWSPTGIIVVALIVVAAAHAVIHRPFDPTRSPGEGRGRTSGGRVTRGQPKPVSTTPDTWGYVYLVGALLAVLVPSVLLGTLTHDRSEHARYVLGYVIYSLIAVFYVAVPSAWAYWRREDAPFTTLFVTLANLERKSHVILLVVLAGLGILVVHLALYPWPDIADILQKHPARDPTAP